MSATWGAQAPVRRRWPSGRPVRASLMATSLADSSFLAATRFRFPRPCLAGFSCHSPSNAYTTSLRLVQCLGPPVGQLPSIRWPCRARRIEPCPLTSSSQNRSISRGCPSLSGPDARNVGRPTTVCESSAKPWWPCLPKLTTGGNSGKSPRLRHLRGMARQPSGVTLSGQCPTNRVKPPFPSDTSFPPLAAHP